MTDRYHSFSRYLKAQFGCRVQKITLDAGLSCPNRDGTLSRGGCIYCNARGSGTGAHNRGLSITDQLELGKAALSRRYHAKKFLAYFQSFSNTYGPLDHLRSLYEEALSVTDVVGLCIGTRPDCIDDGILTLLENYAKTVLIWVEYGLQSAHDRTLEFIHRGHDFTTFQNAVQRTAGRGIRICTHVILGLPGEGRREMLQTARCISRLPIDGVKLHLLYVIRKTRMENLYRSGAYRCLEQEEYVERVCDFLERLPASMVIQRLTGDPHPEELVAPCWALQKRETLQMIHECLENRNTRQGRLFGKDMTADD